MAQDIEKRVKINNELTFCIFVFVEIGFLSLSNISFGQTCTKFFNSFSKSSIIFFDKLDPVSLLCSSTNSFKNFDQYSVSTFCHTTESG